MARRSVRRFRLPARSGAPSFSERIRPYCAAISARLGPGTTTGGTLTHFAFNEAQRSAAQFHAVRDFSTRTTRPFSAAGQEAEIFGQKK